MHKLRILVVEDEMISAMELEEAIVEAAPAEIITRTSLAGTEAVLDREFDFAFLDIEVTDGRTFDIARRLDRKFIPFAFVSGLHRRVVPGELQGAPFIAKPFTRTEIAAVLRSLSSNDDESGIS